MSWVRRRLAAEGGFTLIELLITLILMSIVMGAITTSFSTAFVGEARAIAEATNEENARLALNRLRMDIHCAQAVTASPGVTAQGGYFIVLTEKRDPLTNDPVCKKIALATGSSWIEWCTIQITISRWQLYRDDLKDCSGDHSTFMVDYIVLPNIWTVNADPTTLLPDDCWQGSIGVDLITNEQPGNGKYEYRLADSIGMRNTSRTKGVSTLC
jgi:prepilin-type N-terminal cleavage/methylation domain-containing protein